MTAWRLRADSMGGVSASDGRAPRSLYLVEILDSMTTSWYFYLA